MGKINYRDPGFVVEIPSGAVAAALRS